MKVWMINGSPRPAGCTCTALTEIGGVLSAHGIEWEMTQIGTGAVSGCIGCGKCRREGGACVIDDGVNDILARLDSFDGIVLGSPVYYAAPSGQLCAFLDRLFYAGGRRMAGKVGAAIVSCRRGGASAAFDVLNKYFLMNNMVVAGSQYWNQVHGNTPEEVRRDLEGMQTMRTLGENIAWLLRSLEAARAAGIEPPVYETRTPTNFIR